MGKKEKINQLLTLTKPELEVLKFFCAGDPNKKIGKELFIEQGTVRGHMREIYIKLGLFGYPTSKRRFIILKEYCHLRCDPEYLEALEEGVTGIDQEGKALIVIEPDEEPDEERIQDVDDMIEEDSKYWLMVIPIEEAEKLPPVELIPINNPPERKPNPFKIGLFIFALIGFAAVAIMGYEFLSGRFSIVPAITNMENPQEPVAEQPTQAPAVVQVEPTQAIQPTNTAIIPTESPTPEPTSAPQPTILFEDNFDDGLSDAWEIVQGSPVVVNGMLSTDQNTWLIVGDPSWKNYSIEFTSTEENYNSFYAGFNAIGVRASDIDNMYAFKWVEHESICSIVRNGEWGEVPQSSFKPGYSPYIFRIIVKNDKISVFLNDDLKASFFSNEYNEGRIALKIYDATSIDNFKVREILE